MKVLFREVVVGVDLEKPAVTLKDECVYERILLLKLMASIYFYE